MITNGTFDTDLSGWETGGSDPFYWKYHEGSGKALTEFYQWRLPPKNAYISQTFGIIGDQAKLEADAYFSSSGGFWLRVYVYAGDQLVSDLWFGSGLHHMTIDLTQYAGRIGKVVFNIDIFSRYGAYTTCWIDNVVLICQPNWRCERPLNGFENNGCGDRRINPECNPPCIFKEDEGIYSKPKYCYIGEGIVKKRV